MFEANAYMIKDAQKLLLMESANAVSPEEDATWRLVGILGDQI